MRKEERRAGERIDGGEGGVSCKKLRLHSRG